MDLHFKWLRKTAQYSNGDDLYLNNIRVADFSWNVMRNRDNPEDKTTYEGRILLPGLQDKNFYDNDTNNLKARLEKYVTAWVNEILK